MEYLEDHGVYADIPVDIIIAAWEQAYGAERVRGWIRQFETKANAGRDFFTETVVKT
jgi:hypothetical protein